MAACRLWGRLANMRFMAAALMYLMVLILRSAYWWQQHTSRPRRRRRRLRQRRRQWWKRAAEKFKHPYDCRVRRPSRVRVMLRLVTVVVVDYKKRPKTIDDLAKDSPKVCKLNQIINILIRWQWICTLWSINGPILFWIDRHLEYSFVSFPDFFSGVFFCEVCILFLRLLAKYVHICFC